MKERENECVRKMLWRPELQWHPAHLCQLITTSCHGCGVPVRERETTHPVSSQNCSLCPRLQAQRTLKGALSVDEGVVYFLGYDKFQSLGQFDDIKI